MPLYLVFGAILEARGKRSLLSCTWTLCKPYMALCIRTSCHTLRKQPKVLINRINVAHGCRTKRMFPCIAEVEWYKPVNSTSSSIIHWLGMHHNLQRLRTANAIFLRGTGCNPAWWSFFLTQTTAIQRCIIYITTTCHETGVSHGPCFMLMVGREKLGYKWSRWRWLVAMG